MGFDFKCLAGSEVTRAKCSRVQLVLSANFLCRWRRFVLRTKQFSVEQIVAVLK
jgi:hypothetical protein